MGKIKNYCQDFLESGGYDLGYDMNNLPEMKDMDTIKQQNVKLWEYKGYKSEKDFYSPKKP